ncbi:MAG: Mo-dependent nitrogenase C-terminal domain-containing protein [Prochloraceae cyanobacterium]
MIYSSEITSIELNSTQNNLLSKIIFDLFQPIRHLLDKIEIRDRKLARLIFKLIPSQCPFEREIRLFGRSVVYIPPLCKLNPVYEQLVSLRFRATCYLVDRCGETI